MDSVRVGMASAMATCFRTALGAPLKTNLSRNVPTTGNGRYTMVPVTSSI